jgi:hypothetical protein
MGKDRGTGVADERVLGQITHKERPHGREQPGACNLRNPA